MKHVIVTCVVVGSIVMSVCIVKEVFNPLQAADWQKVSTKMHHAVGSMTREEIQELERKIQEKKARYHVAELAVQAAQEALDELRASKKTDRQVEELQKIIEAKEHDRSQLLEKRAQLIQKLEHADVFVKGHTDQSMVMHALANGVFELESASLSGPYALWAGTSAPAIKVSLYVQEQEKNIEVPADALKDSQIMARSILDRLSAMHE